MSSDHCSKCYGRGYSSATATRTVAQGDSLYSTEPYKSSVRFDCESCNKCQRGKELSLILAQARREGAREFAEKVNSMKGQSSDEYFTDIIDQALADLDKKRT